MVPNSRETVVQIDPTAGNWSPITKSGAASAFFMRTFLRLYCPHTTGESTFKAEFPVLDDPHIGQESMLSHLSFHDYRRGDIY